ncbi:bifunctional aminoglycoside phosphotransferase/ATP-binding protein [Acidocella sp.]|uniref:bifunctional aminoglycoside phosphotransferase/ATP-binding protein n=1 Tax=Acidocella sp. TaxID=50710 RepID=UPI0026040F15|nr:bifunctional aminoglycoside phosphotransferase/ATP-binding protein [Acidocella sp.]
MDDQSEVIEFLKRGAEFVRETHVSYVFLHKDFVYKLKKSVSLPFVDQSSRARRRELCEAELRRNRRTAPGLYLAVRGVGAEGFDPPVPQDYVVEMRRFDEAGLLSALARRGALAPGLLRALADEIAMFHQGAERLARDGAAALGRVIAGNEERLRAFVPPLPEAEVEALIGATRAALARQAARLAARGAEHIRRCHGDLHLGNIVAIGGQPVLFDAIEFSDEFAVIDTAYDVAFLLMDLCAEAAPESANLVMNRYIDRTGDEAAVALLPLFMAVRAAIRAHVLAAQGRDGVAYVHLSAAALCPAVPRLVAIGGMSGTGKSTLAAALAPRFGGLAGARVLRSDVLRKRLFGVAPETRLGAQAYTVAASDRTYGEMFDQAGRALAAGVSVGLDAAFLRGEEREAAEALAARHGVAFSGFWLEAPEVVLAARIEGRENDASDATAAVMRAQRAHVTGPQTWRRLDAAASLQDSLDLCLRAFQDSA